MGADANLDFRVPLKGFMCRKSTYDIRVLPEIWRRGFLTQMGELWRLLLVQPLIVEKRSNTIHMYTDKKPFSQALFQYQIVWGFLEVFKTHCRARWSWRDDASAHPFRRHR